MGMSEKEIEDYFITHLFLVDEDLILLKRQYVVNRYKRKVGIIDILCVQGEDKRYVIIEVKKGDLVARDMGQVLAYYNALKGIDDMSSTIKRVPKIVFICTGVEHQFRLAYETIVDMGIDIDIKIVKQDSSGMLILDDFFDNEYGRLIIKK